MRDYARVSPRFWTGQTGRWLRKQGRDLQVLAFYFITCPSSNMIGLYYLPLPIIIHETGLPMQTVRKGLQRLTQGGFAHYDQVSEIVWVPEMVRFQIGESLSERDNRIKGILRELLQFKDCSFAKDFYEKYKDAYHLDRALKEEGLESPLMRHWKPLVRGSIQEQEQEQEQDPLGGGPLRLTHEEIQNRWNAIPGVKPCKALLPTITKRIKVYLNMHPDSAWWDTLFQQVRAADFLCGRRNGRDGPFQATLEWTLRSVNLDKIVSGDYDKVAPSPKREALPL